MDPDPDSLLLLGGCFLILAFASAADAAFTSVTWRRISTLLAEQARRSPMLAQLTHNPYRFKATMILLNTGAIIAAAGLVLAMTDALPTWAQMVALVGLLLIILVVSAALPKALVMQDPQAWVLRLATPVSLISWLLWPLVAAVNVLIKPFAPLVGRESITRTPLVIEEELRLLVNAGEEEGVEPSDEIRFIESIISLNETEVREIMVPRVDIVAFDVNTPLDEALDTIVEEGHSRLPLYDETIDTIIGLLYVKDLIPQLRRSRHEITDMTLRDFVRPMHFVTETVAVDSLLKDMQQSKVQMAIIVDEFGGTAGLVTIEDLLEQIVGDIHDEYDNEPDIQVVSTTELLVHANTPIADINEMTRLELEAEDVDRIGGLVYEKLRRVPRVGDCVEVPGATISVRELTRMRPEKLRIVLHSPDLLRVPTPVEHVLQSGPDYTGEYSATDWEERVSAPDTDTSMGATVAAPVATARYAPDHHSLPRYHDAFSEPTQAGHQVPNGNGTHAPGKQGAGDDLLLHLLATDTLHAGSYTNGNGNGHAGSYTNGNGNGHAGSYTNGNGNGHTGSYTNGNGHTGSYTNGNGHAGSYTNGNGVQKGYSSYVSTR